MRNGHFWGVLISLNVAALVIHGSNGLIGWSALTSATLALSIIGYIETWRGDHS